MRVEIDEFLKDLIPEYIEGRKKDVLKIEELLIGSEINEIEKISHKMAGNLGSYGFHELGKIAALIEEHCIKNEVEPLSGLVAKLKSGLDDLGIVYK